MPGTLLVNIICGIWETRRWKNFSRCLQYFWGQCQGWQETPLQNLAGERVNRGLSILILSNSRKVAERKEFISLSRKATNLYSTLHITKAGQQQDGSSYKTCTAQCTLPRLDNSRTGALTKPAQHNARLRRLDNSRTGALTKQK